MLARVGARRAKAMYGGTLQAVELIRQRIHCYRIDCDAVEAGVIWANWFRDPTMLRARQRLLAERYGVDWQWVSKSRLRELIHKLYRDMLKVFPQLDGVAVDHAWSGLMSYARHQMPQVGLTDDGLWLAQAFGGHGVSSTTFVGELVASAIAEGDARWRDFSDLGLASAWKPAGLAAAQLSYWWAGLKDERTARRESRRERD